MSFWHVEWIDLVSPEDLGEDRDEFIRKLSGIFFDQIGELERRQTDVFGNCSVISKLRRTKFSKRTTCSFLNVEMRIIFEALKISVFFCVFFVHKRMRTRGNARKFPRSNTVFFFNILVIGIPSTMIDGRASSIHFVKILMRRREHSLRMKNLSLLHLGVICWMNASKFPIPLFVLFWDVFWFDVSQSNQPFQLVNIDR